MIGSVVFVEHVIEVVVGGDGDEGVEVFGGELVLEGEGLVVEEGGGEAGGEEGEGGAVAVDDHDAGVAADVAEGLVVGAGDDAAAVAAHEAEAGGAARGGGEVGLVPGLAAAGARGGFDGVRVAAERGARGHGFHGDRRGGEGE